ncbi:MAG: rRNA maturation RNase YbeY [Mariniphaga sp.]|nr:rRNA maturation RNase YbeY [Mariniphaga sp.]
MSILYNAEEVKKPKLRYRIVSTWLKLVVLKYGFITGELSYIFCNDEYLKSINSKYLNHDYYTDIVTFDYREGKVVSGDMFISVDRVIENAELFQCNVNDEFLRVIVHGLLHLLDFNDSNDLEKLIMREKENECIFMYNEICNEYIK